MSIFYWILIILTVILCGLFALKYVFKRQLETERAKAQAENRVLTDNVCLLRYTKYRDGLNLGLAYAFLGLVCCSTVFPFFWMICTSLKTVKEAVNNMQLQIFPEVPQWQNYLLIWEKLDLWTGLKNTLIVEVATIPICTFLSALEAFAFAKMKMKYKTTVLLILMSGLMVPYASVVLPQYKAYFALGLVDTLWPLILPSWFGNVSLMFFFIQYMRGVPNALFEAAKIDGAKYFVSFVTIMLPLMTAALACQIIFAFVSHWNNFFGPSIYLTTDSVKTLQVKLQALSQSGTDKPMLYTGAFITCIPLFVVYICFQKYFVGSLAISGIKG